MKKIFRNTIRGLVAGAATLTSCNGVLDLDPTGWYGEPVAYASVTNMDYYVKGLYAVLYANSDISNGYIMDDGVSELLKYSWWGDKGQVNQAFYNTNYVTVDANYRSNWSTMYTYIRQLNEFFYDISNGRADKLDPEQVKIRKAEVRFLRAFAYQELVIRHGGVILRISEDHVDGPNERTKARSTKEECYEFIISEYTKAAEDLPEVWEDAATNFGRITKAAAIGMKARACLYAGRYDEAIQACDDVLKMGYDMLPVSSVADYNKIYTAVGNKEVILAAYFQQGTGNASAKQHNFNTYFCAPGDPIQLGLPNFDAGVCATPSDEYASMFDIKVGDEWQAFSWDNLAAYGNEPFQNRDIRFYASILYNGADWLGRKLDLTVESKNYMKFATSGQDNVHKTTTGYVIRKFLSDSPKINFTNILSGQYWIEMRAAEIYLIRSECYARKGTFDKAYADLNAVRTRVGMPERGQKASWNEYLTDLSQERVCELGLEGHRYFDLTRWGIATKTLDGKRLHGIEITKNSDGTLNYTRVECDTQDRHFEPKMNIFPIPKAELKNNSACEQNEEWL